MPDTDFMTEDAMTDEISAIVSPRHTSRALPLVLLKAREAVMSRFRPMLANHGVTEQQWRVIRTLAETGTLDASELAERAFILAPSLTRMIRSLEERGYISRHKDRIDGRRVLLKIAPAGIELIREVTPEANEIYAGLEEKFGKQRIDEMLAMLMELAALREGSGPPTFSDD